VGLEEEGGLVIGILRAFARDVPGLVAYALYNLYDLMPYPECTIGLRIEFRRRNKS
jgi:hypothetical protein